MKFSSPPPYESNVDEQDPKTRLLTGKLTTPWLMWYNKLFAFLQAPSLPGYTVAKLPTGVVGMQAYVSDALTPTFGSVVVGGGSVTMPVFYNGSAWIVG